MKILMNLDASLRGHDGLQLLKIKLTDY